MKRLEIKFFNIVVDGTLISLDERFATLEAVENKFSVLTNYHNMDEETIKLQCESIGKALTCGDDAEFDWNDLSMEIQNLPT